MYRFRPSLLTAVVLISSSFVFFSCDDDDKELTPVVVPDTYTFERNGQSSVSYSGQIARLDQLSELKAYLVKGDKKQVTLNADVLNAMYANIDGNGGGNFTFTSEGKQLRDKTFAPDVAYYESLFTEAAAASAANADAAEGSAGFLTRGSSTILVNANGQEYTQLIEKGLMGSVFLNQIYNVYLTDERIGDGVENTALDGSNNYTKMEHHWDEAFGYFGVPVDFPTTLPTRFWGNYSNVVNPFTGSNALLIDAFKTGRAAIVAKRYDVKNEQREILYKEFELVAAATAIHYLNEAKLKFAAQNRGDAFHSLSEAYAFIRALRVSPKKRITDAQLTAILDTHIGDNFWAVEQTDLSGLSTAINTIVAAYPELTNFKDQL